jgi:hypothetical protein
MQIRKRVSNLAGLLSITFLFVILVVFWINSTAKPAFSHGFNWVPGNGKLCQQVCSDAGLTAVYSGTYINGNQYYVCATNAQGGGFRPGYNLLPNWSTTCTVGLGGQELSFSSYYCLCQ